MAPLNFLHMPVATQVNARNLKLLPTELKRLRLGLDLLGQFLLFLLGPPTMQISKK